MKTISFSDIRRVSWLRGYTEAELLEIHMDEKINDVLQQLGFDIEYPVIYYPAKHRNLANEVVLGYIAAGEVDLNKSRANKDFSSLTDILVCSCYGDVSLMKELAELSYKVRDFDEYLNDCDSFEGEVSFPTDQLEPDFEAREAQILQMEQYRDAVRGPAYNSAGALKSAEEYQEWLEEQKGNND